MIYLDPPYKGTREYRKEEFDHEALYEWCEKQTQPVFISEYSMPDDRFVCVDEWRRTSSYSATNNGLKRVEKIFIPKHQEEMWRRDHPEQTKLF